MGRLQGRRAFVTGGSQGIGAAAARSFAREGADILLMARSYELLEEVAAEIRQFGVQATPIVGDLSDRESVAAVAEQVVNACPDGLDIFLANGGTEGPRAPIAAVPPAAWDAMFQVNVLANVQFLHALQPLLEMSTAGRVIFVSSGAAHVTHLGITSYGVTKAALEAIGRVYAADNENSSIRANIINPGFTRTQMRARLAPDEDPNSLHTPEDVAQLLLKLADPECDFTGTRINFMEWQKQQQLQ